MITHELTRVVQHNGGQVQTKKENASRTRTTQTAIDQAGIVQPMLDKRIMCAQLYKIIIESGGQSQIGSIVR